MNQIRILLAEDNPLHASKMEMLLDILGYQLVGIGSSEEQVKELFGLHEPDLVIMDISLSGDGDGIKLAAELQRIRPTPLMFLTSFEDKETLNRALDTNPYAYLIKPIERPSLQAAIELAFRQYKLSKGEVVSESRSPESDELIQKDSFLIKSGNKMSKVPLKDILWIEVSQDRYCDIVTKSRNYSVRTSISHLESRLDPSIFVRIHRSHIVNIHKIDGVDDFDMVIEVGDKSLPLGGAYKNQLLERFRLL
ncbi:MAG: hypothetical protein CMP48_07270 [Rickettsiales bacterium]|nr:hypothetical protein [Rickettsiales bacterium]